MNIKGNSRLPFDEKSDNREILQ